MKDFKAIISYLLAGIAAILLIIYVGGQCSEKKPENTVTTNEVSQARQLLKDSLDTYYSHLQREREDSIQAYYYTRIEESKDNASYYKAKAAKQGKSAEYYKHIADSLSHEAPDVCASVVKAYREANDTLTAQNASLITALTLTEQEAQQWCELSESKEREINVLDSLVISKTNTINPLS